MRSSESEVRGLVAHDRAELFEARPVREDPDHVGLVRGVRALEAVPQAELRRRHHCVDERDVRVRDVELSAGLGQSRERGLDVFGLRRRDPDLVRLNVDAEPSVDIEYREPLEKDSVLLRCA